MTLIFLYLFSAVTVMAAVDTSTDVLSACDYTINNDKYVYLLQAIDDGWICYIRELTFDTLLDSAYNNFDTHSLNSVAHVNYNADTEIVSYSYGPFAKNYNDAAVNGIMTYYNLYPADYSPVECINYTIECYENDITSLTPCSGYDTTVDLVNDYYNVIFLRNFHNVAWDYNMITTSGYLEDFATAFNGVVSLVDYVADNWGYYHDVYENTLTDVLNDTLYIPVSVDDYVDENNFYYQWCKEHADEYVYVICRDISFSSDYYRKYDIYFTPAGNYKAFVSYLYDDAYTYNDVSFKYAYKATVNQGDMSVYEAFYKAVNGELSSVVSCNEYSESYKYNPLSTGMVSANKVIYSNRALFYDPAAAGYDDEVALYINQFTYDYMVSNGYSQEDYFINPLIADSYDGFVDPGVVEQPSAPTPTPVPEIDIADTNGDGIVDDSDSQIVGWYNRLTHNIGEILNFFENAADDFGSMLLALFVPDAEYMQSLYANLITNIPVVGEVGDMFFVFIDVTLSDSSVEAPAFTLEMSQLSGPLHMKDIEIDLSVDENTLNQVRNVSGLFFIGSYFFKEFLTLYKLFA